jgi:ABC-2 type transport system ATP-binding protein
MSLAVETKGLKKSYNGFMAHDGLDISVPEGCIYGFLGPNGSGKTTTLKILTGMTRTSGGSVSILGKPVIFGSGKNIEDVGFLPDVPGFYDWMTAIEFLSFCGNLFSLDRVALKERVNSLLETVGLTEFPKKKIGGYSRGMKQRLGIAQALINQPKVVFLDEPVSALDPVGRKEVMNIIQSLSGKHTVFFSTHVLDDVERVCDRVVIINHGKAVAEGSLDQIKSMSAPSEMVLEAEGLSPAEFVEWVAKIEGIKQAYVENGRKIHVNVDDLNLARAGINRLVYEKEIQLRRLEVLEPTLEDIFLRVVKKDA